MLQRQNGTYAIGMTNLDNHTVYINKLIHGKLLKKVFRHELCHVYCLEYRIILPMYFEEIFADALATYGESILNNVDLLCLRYGKC